MDKGRKFAHIIAYYLSRFDKVALYNLGFKTDKEAFSSTSAAIGVKPNYIKFRRDEFDVIHPFRQGWHKRPMTLSISNTINALQDLDEPTLRAIIKEILLKGASNKISDDMEQLINILPKESEKKKRKNLIYTSRGLTGKKAEEEFLNQYKKGKIIFPAKGIIKDVRETGCGYDFELISKKEKYFIEVKGIASNGSGIMFTNKEWETAEKETEKYYLVVISGLDTKPKVKLIKNPASSFNPKMSVQTVIQVNWILTEKEINNCC